jgi:hypothetical protein
MSDVIAPRLAAAEPDLRSRIAWICQGLRIAAVLWLVWILAMVFVVWSDKAAVLEAYTRYLSLDLAGVSDARYAAAVALVLFDSVFVAAVVFCIWGLFSTYLAGRVFTTDAALWLRRIGVAGIVAAIGDVLIRTAVVSTLAGHFVLGAPHGFFLLPQDLLHLIFSVFILAFAHIFKAAAEMADDHAQIV